MKAAVCATGLLLATPLAAVAEEPRAAPPLELETVVAGPAPAELSWAALAGQAVVVEFWATWCAPCVAAMPRWNALVERFAGQPVRFLSVSDEDEPVVRRFLERHELRGWIALDADRSVFEGFEVLSLPQTALVDAEGRLRAVAGPGEVTAEVVQLLLAGETPEVRGPVSAPALGVELDAAGGPRPVFRAVIRPATGQRGMKAGPGTWLALSQRLPSALAAAWRTSDSRLVIECELPETRYDFLFETGRDSELLMQVLRRAIEGSFGLEVVRETRRADGLVLEPVPGGRPELAPAAPDAVFTSASSNGRMELRAASLADLASALEDWLGVPVVDGSGIAGAFDVELTWDPQREDGPRRALAPYGLRLRPAEVTAEMQVVRCAGES